MNIREGAGRTRYVGRTTLLVTSCGLLLALILSLLECYTDLALTLHVHLMPIIILLFVPTIFACLCLVADWIIEGFAQPFNDSSC